MTDKEQKSAAKKFAEYWKDKGYEKGESQPFWLSLLRDVFGVSEPEKFIAFEEQVHLDHTSFIDGHISVTNVLIEQKSKGKNLRSGIKQSDGSMLTPFQQAKRYSSELPYSQRPRWIVTCNFEEFLIYDMEKPNCEPEQIFLKDLPKEYYRLNFLTDTGDENIKKEMEVSLQAGELVGKLYNASLKQYKNPDNPESLKSLNMLCVRLVFCLYAEDAGIFGRHNMFHDSHQVLWLTGKDGGSAAVMPVIEGPDADGVPCGDELPRSAVIDDAGKLRVQHGKHSRAILPVQGEQDLAVGPASERIAFLFQHLPEPLKAIDLAVAHTAAALPLKGLHPLGGEAHDGQPVEAQQAVSGPEHPAVVRAAADGAAKAPLYAETGGVCYAVLPRGTPSEFAALLDRVKPGLVHLWGSEYPPAAALLAQSEYSQLQRVGGKFWDPVAAFADSMAKGNPSGASLQSQLDRMVEGVTAR